ncbi:MAG: cold-shock protein [Bacteroidia bacterium]
MAKSQQTFNKKAREEKKRKKKKEKREKREERKSQAVEGTLDNMMAYVDEFGNIVDSPPDPNDKQEVDAEQIRISVPKDSELELEEKENNTSRKGKVTHFNDSKGYGFIRDLNMADTIFVHINQVKGEIKEGDKVTYELEKTPKGWNAVNVEKGK